MDVAWPRSTGRIFWPAGLALGHDGAGNTWGRVVLGIVAFIALAMAAPPPPATSPYLPRPVLVEAASQLPPPPAPGSATDLADRQHYREVTLNLPDRTIQRARKLMVLNRPAQRQALSCALGAQIDPKLTPELVAILQRVDLDVGHAGGTLKFGGEKRVRPTSIDGSLACDGRTAESRPGSTYPSRHAATGYLWALILAELRPERRADLLDFGTEIGDLWVACRINWRSDAEQGRKLARALLPQLLKSPAFKADLAKARAALASAPPPFSC